MVYALWNTHKLSPPLYLTVPLSILYLSWGTCILKYHNAVKSSVTIVLPDCLIQVFAENPYNRRDSRRFANIAKTLYQITPIMSKISKVLDGVCTLEQPQAPSSFISNGPLFHSASVLGTCILKYHNAFESSMLIIFLVLLNFSVHILLYMHIPLSSST